MHYVEMELVFMAEFSIIEGLREKTE